MGVVYYVIHKIVLLRRCACLYYLFKFYRTVRYFLFFLLYIFEDILII